MVNDASVTSRSRFLTIYGICAIIVALYVGEVVAITHVLHYSVPIQGSNRLLRLAIIVLAILQGGALYVLYRSLKLANATPRLAIALCAACMAVTSFSFINPQGDALAYIAYAKLPTLNAAYHMPSPYIPPKGFETITLRWSPVPTCRYGPLWVALAQATVRPASTLGGAMFILRFTGLVFVALLIFALLRLSPTPATISLVVCNPFLYFAYVLEAHNDIIPIALVMWGTVIALRRPMIASIIGGVACAVKAAFFPISLLMFANGTAQRRNLGAPIAVLIVVGLLASLIPGTSYLDGLLFHAVATQGKDHSVASLAVSAIHVALAVVALIAIFLAVVRKRFDFPASFSFIAISAFPYPQYLAWGIAYAWGTRFTPAFLIALPVLGAFMNSDAASRVTEFVVLVASLVSYVGITGRSFALQSQRTFRGDMADS